MKRQRAALGAGSPHPGVLSCMQSQLFDPTTPEQAHADSQTFHADKDRFRAVVPDNPDVVVKPMFGNPGAFVKGNMFAGLFGP